jgi:hypothetical protein
VNRPTRTSAVTCRSLNRDLPEAQPLPTRTSAVIPTGGSAVAHGSGAVVGSYLLVFEPFRVFLQAVAQEAPHASRRLTPLAGGAVAPHVSQRLKTSRGSLA